MVPGDIRSRGGGPESLATPPKLQVGDRVALLSPSWAGAGVFPLVHERGVRVLVDTLHLEPVEYPTTRQIDASAEERARDVNAAFADPSVKAVLSVIGGSDQLTVLPHLDASLISANPKPFFGYSDNTNLLNYLWNVGVVGYHGGSTLVHLARPGGVHPVFLQSLRRALFTNETALIEPVSQFTDLQPRWEDPSTLDEEVETTPERGWHWHNAHRVVTGRTWGGNLEILHWNLAANRWIQPNETYRGCVLLLETSEEMPSADEVYIMLRNAGERGLLSEFAAVVVAKPKAWHPHAPLDEIARETYRTQQRAAILRALGQYNADALVVFGPDFGHTDPQYIVPYGGWMTVDGPARTISVTY